MHNWQSGYGAENRKHLVRSIFAFGNAQTYMRDPVGGCAICRPRENTDCPFPGSSVACLMECVALPTNFPLPVLGRVRALARP